jgi:hypothetical protein
MYVDFLPVATELIGGMPNVYILIVWQNVHIIEMECK